MEDWELYDENNEEHRNRTKYEVMEWSDELDYKDGRHPNSVECGDILSDAQRR